MTLFAMQRIEPYLRRLPQLINGASHRSALPKWTPIIRHYKTWDCPNAFDVSRMRHQPGSDAFIDCETSAIIDLFHQFADDGHMGTSHVRDLLESIGERPDDATLDQLFKLADSNGDGKLNLVEFMNAADKVLAGAPARIVLVVGGPGSGKGLLCDRLVKECGVAHLSSGDLLRDEISRDTPLGRECKKIMEKGELISSKIVTTLIRRRMRSFPGRRVLLDGFPRSLQNCIDFSEQCGQPELALHLECDDTVLMERILIRARQNKGGVERDDDNIDTALKRIRTFNGSHEPTMEWLREQHVPVVNLDCSGTPDNVWAQLTAIGRLMRPAAAHRPSDTSTAIDETASSSNDDSPVASSA